MGSKNYHKNLATRVQKSKSIEVLGQTSNWVKVQGSENTYTVMVKRIGTTLLTDCVKDTGEVCKGNKYGTVCYHSMRAAVELAEAGGYKVAFCASREHADRLSHIGGKVYRIKSHNGTGKLWMVVQKVVRIRDWRETHLENIERGIKVQEEALENNAWSFLAQMALNNLVATRESLREQLV